MAQEAAMKNNNLIYVIEDEEDLGQLMCRALENFRYQVRYFANGVDALTAAQKDNPDICIVDLNLPDIDGLELVKQFDRQQRGVIIVSGRDDLTDRVLGLEFGADDYVIKPVKPRLLVTRIRTLLRRVTPSNNFNESQVEEQRLKINQASRLVTYDDADISLTAAEFDLLVMLAQHAGDIIDREAIVQNLRGFEYDGLDRSVDRRISRLRRKLNDNSQDPTLIKTIRGKGYMLCTNYSAFVDS